MKIILWHLDGSKGNRCPMYMRTSQKDCIYKVYKVDCIAYGMYMYNNNSHICVTSINTNANGLLVANKEFFTLSPRLALSC